MESMDLPSYFGLFLQNESYQLFTTYSEQFTMHVIQQLN